MSEEKVLSDFSQGMNAQMAVDKLAPNECLLAENVRLDEAGNIAIAGALTHQNTSSYAVNIGTAAFRNIHSLYWNPALGAVAGIFEDVFTGLTLGALTSNTSLAPQSNHQQLKQSFGSAPGRVYFDVGNVGYWTDETLLLPVDWPPPSAAADIASGPNTAGTITNTAINSQTATATNFGFSLGTTSNMQGIRFVCVTTSTVTQIALLTSTLKLVASLIVGGSPVGTSTSLLSNYVGSGTFTETFTFGGAGTLWGFNALSPAQVNASSFGVNVYSKGVQGFGGYTRTIAKPICTSFQAASGFVSGAGAAGTLTGTYTWKITFVAANGEESDGSNESAQAILATQAGTLTAIQTGDGRTVARNIYRKSVGAGGLLTLHYLVGSIPDNATTTYSDNLTDIAALTAGVILAGDVPGDTPNTRLDGVQVKFPVYHYDRVFWINQNVPNQILWSKPLNGFAYPATNFSPVGDGEPISRIASIFGELIIIKKSSVWRLTGTDESSFNLSQTPSNQGTDLPFTVVVLPDRILFTNRTGIWAFNGYTATPLTPKLDLWFRQEDRTGSSLFGVNGFHPPGVGINDPATPLFEAVGNAEKYVLAYREAFNPNISVNNAILFIDLKHGNITKRATGGFPIAMAIDPVNGYIYIGDATTGFISLLDDWNGAQAGPNPLNMDWQDGYRNFARGSNQSFWALEFLIQTNGQNVTPFVYYDNGNSNEQLAAIATTGFQRVVRTLQSANARKAQNISIRLNASSSSVNVAGTPQIILQSVKVMYGVRTGRARTGQ